MLEIGLLCNGAHGKVAQYFISILEERRVSFQEVSRLLLEAVQRESIPPRIVSIWLKVCQEPLCATYALRSESLHVRRLAIEHIGRWVRSKEIAEIWTALGDTKGIVNLMATMSVAEVKAICLAFGRSSTSNKVREARQARMSELLRVLASEYFPDSTLTNPDSRHILRLYCPILAACSPATRKAWIENSDLPKPRCYEVMQAEDCFMSALHVSNQEASIQTKSSDLWPLIQEADAHSETQLGRLRGVSKDMLFTLHKIWQSCTSKERSHKAVPSGETIVVWGTSVLKRLGRKRCDPSTIIDILDLVYKALMDKENGRRFLSLKPDGLISQVVKLWARHTRDDIERRLGMLLELSTFQSSMLEIPTILTIAKWSDRYKLLRLILLRVKAFGIEIECEAAIDCRELKWPISLFFVLPRQQATELLRRLEQRSLEWKSSPSALLRQDQRGDCTLLYLMLSSDPDWRRETAAKFIRDSKHEAVKSREQDERAYWAQRAVMGAIACRDYTAYSEVLTWARRFAKDPTTTKVLYDHGTVGCQESKDLICGVPEQVDQRTAATISESVRKGNDIARLLIQTACATIVEPSFSSNDWNCLRVTVGEAVQLRMSRIGKAHSKLKLSDQWLSENVWQPTLEALLELEQVGLQEENEGLQWQTMGGLLGAYDPSTITDQQPSQSTLEFLNSLASSRNLLWEEYRLKQHPAVAALPKHFPRGLPLQYLIRLDRLGHPAWIAGIPYVFERARSIVFSGPEVLNQLPSKTELLTAIGPFVDNFETALKYYVSAHRVGKERDASIEKAWTHVTEKLVTGRVETWKARALWYCRFQNVGFPPKIIVADLDLPELPRAESLTDILEWNPDPTNRSEVSDNEAPVTLYIDCLLEVQHQFVNGAQLATTGFSYYKSYEDVFSHDFWNQAIPGVTLPGIKQPPRSQEATIVAALLYIAEKLAGGESILSKPFPSEAEPRFPAILLDNDFWERAHLRECDAISVLKSLLPSVPTSFLLSLAKRLVIRLADPKLGLKLHDIYHVIGITGDTHMPWRFLELQLQIMIDRPDDSSWHRQLLKKSTFDRLPAARAQLALAQLEEVIAHKFEGSKPVKITTLKQLATLLWKTESFDHKASVELLFIMFKEFRHIDVQVAVLQGLASIYENTTPMVRARILDGCKEHVVEIAASINERRLITEAEWMRAEAEKVAPQPSTGGFSPLTDVLLRLIKKSNLSTSGKLALLQQVLLPIFTQSSVSIRRWIRLFAAQNELPLTEGFIRTVVPLDFAREIILNHPQLVTKEFLELYKAAADGRANASADLEIATDLVRDSQELRISDSGKFWLTRWGQGTSPAEVMADTSIVNLLIGTWSTELPNEGLSHEHVQTMILAASESLILQCSQPLDTLSPYLAPLMRLDWGNAHQVSVWKDYARPVVNSAIRRVKDLRTMQWQVDAGRAPRFLPDTFSMELWLLSYPDRMANSDNSRHEVFAAELSKLIDAIVMDGRPYATRFLELTRAAKGIKSVHKLPVALALPQPKSDGSLLPMADILRVDLALALMQGAGPLHDHESLSRGCQLATAWEASTCEDIRIMGYKAKQIFENLWKFRSRTSASV